MAAERQYIQETIANVKRALAMHSDGSESDNSIAYTSNRGRKLKRKARNVHESALDNRFGLNGYKEEIEYYGKAKKIIYRKPDRRKKYAADSDDESSEDSDGDGSGSEDTSPYAEVQIGKLLAPLESAADLPSHPSMSHVYTSRTLNELIQQSLTKVCEEHDHTVQLKNLLTKFMGDDPFVNLEKMEWPEEDYGAAAHERGEALFRDYAGFNIMNGVGREQGAETNGTSANRTSTNSGNSPEEGLEANMDDANGANVEEGAGADEHPSPLEEEEEAPPEPRRMTTRSANNNSRTSPASAETPNVEIDPFFYPPNYHVDRDNGLPPQDAEETRRLLIAAVQRQDEFLRGLNRMRMSLLRAERLRKKVWEWCRIMEGMREYHHRLAEESGQPARFDIDEAEGVGLSDGEDWYDMEEWNLEEPLEKGREEEEEGMEPVQGKKTRGRRN